MVTCFSNQWLFPPFAFLPRIFACLARVPSHLNFCPLLIASKFCTKRTFNWYLLLSRIPLVCDNEVGDLLAVMSSSDGLLPLSNQHLTMTGIRGKFENKNTRAQDASQFLEQNERIKRTHTNAHPPSIPAHSERDLLTFNTSRVHSTWIRLRI